MHKLFEQIMNVFYAITAFPNLIITIALFALVVFSIYKSKWKNILGNKYFWTLIIAFFLFPLLILISGVIGSNAKLPFDESRGYFIKQTIFIHLFFYMNIVFAVFVILKSKAAKIFYISFSLLNLWISLMCFAFSLLMTCNNVFI